MNVLWNSVMEYVPRCPLMILRFTSAIVLHIFAILNLVNYFQRTKLIRCNEPKSSKTQLEIEE